jgi:hypothetical protein
MSLVGAQERMFVSRSRGIAGLIVGILLTHPAHSSEAWVCTIAADRTAPNGETAIVKYEVERDDTLAAYRHLNKDTRDIFTIVRNTEVGLIAAQGHADMMPNAPFVMLHVVILNKADGALREVDVWPERGGDPDWHSGHCISD